MKHVIKNISIDDFLKGDFKNAEKVEIPKEESPKYSDKINFLIRTLNALESRDHQIEISEMVKLYAEGEQDIEEYKRKMCGD